MKYNTLLLFNDNGIGFNCIARYDFNDDAFAALEAYANIPNPASQLIEANDKEELERRIDDVINKIKSDEEFINQLRDMI